MSDYNRLTATGRLTRDPELRYTQSGKSICNFAIAVNGYKKDDVLFLDCAAWGKTGETINTHLTKGDPILVEGELKIEKWETKDGQPRSKPVCTVRGFTFIGGPKHAEKGQPDEHTNDPMGGESDFETIPF